MTNYAPVPGLVPASPANHDYKPGFAAKMMLKDLLLSQNAAQSSKYINAAWCGSDCTLFIVVNQGNGDVDFSGIIKMIQGKK